MGQPDRVESLLEENIGLIHWVICKHYPTFIGDDDVVQEARIGLWKACISFDESKGAFSSYAVMCILNNVRMYFRREKRHGGCISLNTVVNEENETEFGDLLEHPDGSVEGSGVFVKDFISSLTEREQKIVYFQFYSVTQKAACKELGCTQAWYSKLLKRIRTKWDDYNKERRCIR